MMMVTHIPNEDTKTSMIAAMAVIARYAVQIGTIKGQTVPSLL